MVKRLVGLLTAMAFVVFLTGCENDQITESSQFPEKLSLEEFFKLDHSVTFGEENRYTDLGSLNESEWYITDNKGKTQYYKLNQKDWTLTTKSTFSGRVLPQKNEISFTDESSKGTVCTRESDGCKRTVIDSGWFFTVAYKCGPYEPLVKTYYPGGLAAYYFCALTKS